MKRLGDALRPGMRVFVPGMSAEPTLLLDELARDGGPAESVDFVSVQFPGIGRADYLSTHPGARHTAFFMTPAVRAGLREGRASLLALDYGGIARYLAHGPAFDLVIAHLSPPDAQGWCSAGISSDFLPIAWPRAARRVAQINPSMPQVPHGFRVHVSELAGMIDHDTPLTEFREAGAAGDVAQCIGERVAQLVQDGDTLQFGIGAIPLALAHALASHRRLRLHTGMVSPAARALSEAGALDPDAPILAGVALGDASLYAWASRERRLHLADVRRTHDVQAIAATPRFMAINSAVEVDLLGQVNAERSDGTLQAGAGGLPAFAQGALQSEGGRLIICMPATARSGAVSRIVPVLGANSACTLPRHLADVVVTEHGLAELRDRSIDQRAQALIAVAAPEHRDSLAREWQATLARL